VDRKVITVVAPGKSFSTHMGKKMAPARRAGALDGGPLHENG
jgi:hypothetical protein